MSHSLHSPVWLFDLDNTLHDASPHIFPHINRSMTLYLQRHLALDKPQADELRRQYWLRYGATLLGLMRHHGTDPHHFLAETHDFPDLRRMVVFDRALKSALKRLPGRKVVFSNAPQRYIEAVLELLGIEQLFDMVFGIERLEFHPKPQPRAFRTVLHTLKVPAQRCIFVEDTASNLRTAKRLGMRTVWVSRALNTPPYVDLRINSALQLPRLRGRLGL